MARLLESRVPLRDQQIVELMVRVPSQIKLLTERPDKERFLTSLIEWVNRHSQIFAERRVALRKVTPLQRAS